MVCHHCLSIRITSPCSEGALLTGCPSWSCCCQFSFSGLAQVLDLISVCPVLHASESALLGPLHARLAQVSQEHRSTRACSLEKRLVRSLWESTFSRASEAFLFKSYVLGHAFRASTQIASWVARRLLKHLLILFKNRLFRFAFTLSASQGQMR